VGNYFVDPDPTAEYGGWTHGFLWNDGEMTEVASSLVGSQKLSVAGINNRGHIVANISAGCLPGIGDAYFQQLFLGQGSTIIQMSTKMPSRKWLGAALSGINDNDKIVGTFADHSPPTANEPPTEAFTYSVKNNKLTLLGIPAPYQRSYGAAINIFSVVAGSVNGQNTIRAAWWNGAWHILPCSGCASTGINYYSEIVGYEGNASGFLWNGQMVALAGFPLAISDGGTIVGSTCEYLSSQPTCHAVVWTGPGHDLYSLDASIAQGDPAYGQVSLTSATAINSRGEIVAEGCWTGGDKKGECRPFLLAPIEAVASR
jgi:uncharacterized membrane protein